MRFLKTLLESLNASDWTHKPNTRMGSNEGGIYTNKEGIKHYVKFYRNPDQTKAEFASTKLHELFGVKTLEPKLVKMNDKLGLATVFDDDVSTKRPSFYDDLSDKHQRQIASMYHAAVILNNRDIVGMEHDNIVHNKKTGDLVSIDHGGSLQYRAMGGTKPFGDDIPEKESLLQYSPASDVFAWNLNKDHLKDSLEHIKKIKDDDIKHVIKSSGMDDADTIADKVIARKNELIRQGV